MGEREKILNWKMEGDDTFFGGAGNDQLEVGGSGSDTADYTGVASDIIANVSTNATGNDIGVDIYSGIENITGGIGKDTDTGSSGDNTLKGMEGDDTISELAGNDIVEGGAGNDYIYAGAGDDIIDGDDTDSGTTNGTSDTLDFTLISINDDSGDTRDVDGTGSDTTTVDAYNGIEIGFISYNSTKNSC